jgi:hypothetical protein
MLVSPVVYNDIRLMIHCSFVRLLVSVLLPIARQEFTMAWTVAFGDPGFHLDSMVQ